MISLKRVTTFSWFLLLTSILLLSNVCTFAQATAASNFQPNFDITQANDALNTGGMSSFLNNASIKSLQHTIASLTKLEAQAKKCVDADTAELDKINKQVAETFPTQEKPSLPSPIQKYLDLKKKQLTDELSACRFFVLRADETIAKLNEKLKAKVKTQMFYAQSNIADNLKKLPSDLQSTFQTFDPSFLVQLSGIYLISPVQGILLIIGMSAAILISFILRRILSKSITDKTEDQFPAHLKQVTLCILKKYLPLLLPTFIFALGVTIFTAASSEEPTFLAKLSYAVILLEIFILLVHFYFYPPKPALGFTTLPTFLTQTLVRRLKIFGWLVFLAYVSYLLFKDQSLPDSIKSILRTLFTTLISISLITVVWLIKNSPKFLYQFTFLRYLISFFLSGLLVIILIAQLLGYQLLASYLLFAITLSIFSIFITRILNNLIKSAADGLNGSQHNWQIRFKRYFGLKSNEHSREVLWLKLVLLVMIWGGLFLCLFKIWGVAQTGFHIVINTIIQGFQIGEFKIVPFNIWIGLIFFIFLSAITRMLTTHIAKNPHTHLDKSNRESLASIISYIGFAIAVIISLLIAGVNFSGLALIAGALSVGIGFGLQNIANNFMSGIILLVQRPIKLGDRIVVGDTEGYVRRISILSTQIITLNRSDIIVPNSDLIQKQVINYMLYDTNFKVALSVGVAYGSDTALVKKLLLEVSRNHPEVIWDRPDHEPTVFFDKFGESALQFKLICLIKNADLKGGVLSDLHFMVEEIFRTHNVEIAFPQRDITVRNWPKTIVNS